MKFEIQVFKKYIVESEDVATTLENSKLAGEQIIRIKEYVEPVVVAEVIE